MDPSFYVSDNVAEDYMVLADDTAQALQKNGQSVSVRSNMGLFDAEVTDDTGVFDLSQEVGLLSSSSFSLSKSLFIIISFFTLGRSRFPQGSRCCQECCQGYCQLCCCKDGRITGNKLYT